MKSIKTTITFAILTLMTTMLLPLPAQATDSIARLEGKPCKLGTQSQSIVDTGLKFRCKCTWLSPMGPDYGQWMCFVPVEYDNSDHPIFSF